MASARKPAVSGALLTRDEGFAYPQPSLAKKKLRRPKLTACPPRQR
jgi:hypothetical protein